MQAQFLSILNRSDCSTDLAQTFITQALTQIEREARLPCMERVLEVTASPTASMGYITIPADFLQPIDLMVQSASGSYWAQPSFTSADTWFPLTHKTYRQLLAISQWNPPSAYGRQGGQFFIAGAVPPNVAVRLFYYGQFTPITDPTVGNEATASIPDLVIYKALGSYAAPYFQHDQGPLWEQTYQNLLQSAQLLAEDADAHGGPMVMAPTHFGDDGMGNWY